jgi:hypothetical protein
MLAAPAIVASTCLVVAQITSEGGLQAIPLYVLELALVGLMAEALARYLEGTLALGVRRWYDLHFYYPNAEAGGAST